MPPFKILALIGAVIALAGLTILGVSLVAPNLRAPLATALAIPLAMLFWAVGRVAIERARNPEQEPFDRLHRR